MLILDYVNDVYEKIRGGGQWSKIKISESNNMFYIYLFKSLCSYYINREILRILAKNIKI